MIRYRVDGKPVSYYLMPADGEGSARSQAEAFRSEATAGYHVVAWRREGLVHALVGDLPRQRLSELARACSRQVAAGRSDAGGSVRVPGAPLAVPLPDVAVPAPDGDTLRLRDRADGVTVVNFWATWCVPCLEEIPDLVALDDSLRARGGRVVGIALSSGSPGDVLSFAAEHDMDYGLGMADHGWARDHFDVFGLPVTLVVDRSDTVRRRLVGPHGLEHFLAAARPYLGGVREGDRGPAGTPGG